MLMKLMTVALVVIALMVIAFGDGGVGGDSFDDGGFGDDGCGGESFGCQPGRLPACGLHWPETRS